jgi:hypothetical protein
VKIELIVAARDTEFGRELPKRQSAAVLSISRQLAEQRRLEDSDRRLGDRWRLSYFEGSAYTHQLVSLK